MLQKVPKKLTAGRKRQTSGIGLSGIPYDGHILRCNMVQEWIVELDDPRYFSKIMQEINTRGWGVLAHPP